MLNDSKHTFAIYTPERTKQRWPIRLAAATELEMHDWVGMERKNSTVESNNVILCSIYSCISSKNVICFSIFASLRLLCPALQLALLSVSCCDSRGIQGPPSKQAIWSITCKGDIFVSEPSPGLEAVPYPTPCDQM